MALYVREKKYITRVCEKNNLTQTNSLIPPPPSQKSNGGPLIICVDLN